MLKLLRRLRILVLALGVLACSETSNPMGIWAKVYESKDPEALLSRAQLALDAGDYPRAAELAAKSLALDAERERAAVVLAFARLAQIGIEPFALLAKLSQETPSLRLTAAGQLDRLSDLLLGADAESLLGLSLEGNRVGDLEGAPRAGPFQAWPVLLPKDYMLARSSAVNVMLYLDQAIRGLCPFVPAELLLNEDGRQQEAPCGQRLKAGSVSAQGLFVWALAHLAESIVFHKLVLYHEPGRTPHLLGRASVLNDPLLQSSISLYVAAVQELAQTLELIMPTKVEQAKASMLNGMVLDLKTVSRALGALPGLPDALGRSLQESLLELDSQQKEIGESTGGLAAGSVALKRQLTGALAVGVRDQIVAKQAAGALTTEEKKTVCSAYKTISDEELAACGE